MAVLSKHIYQTLLATDGVNQEQRFQQALDPDRVQLDGRSAHDLIRFVSEMSSEIRYYNRLNVPQGDWWPFFDQFRRGNELLSDRDIEALLVTRNDLPAHIALLLAFIRIFGHAQQDLNALTRKRLRFYYEDVLQLRRKPSVPDQVHVLFELSKNADPVLIPAGSLLDAGKTITGAPRQYALDNDLVVSHAAIGSLKSSFTDFSKGKAIVFGAADATSVLNETGTAWRPFGAPQLSAPVESRTMEAVRFGWAVASPNLFLAEGRRIVRMKLQLKSVVGTTASGLPLASMMEASLTGEKEWLKPDQILAAELTAGIPIELQDPDLENPFELEISLLLLESSPAVTAYSEPVHLTGTSTSWPVMRILLRPDSYLLEYLSQFRVDSVSIEVEVEGVKNLLLQNDLSVQPADKPILPFGSVPFIGSNFYIGSREIFSKSISSLKLKMEWQDAPEDLADHYAAYDVPGIGISAFTAHVDLLAGRNWNVRLLTNQTLFNSLGTALPKEMPVPPSTFASATASSPFKRKPDLTLPPAFSGTSNQGFMRVVLTGPTRADLGNVPPEAPFEAFGHKTFPIVQTRQIIALSQFSGAGTPPELPKPPYTPTLKSVSLDYTAKDVFKPSAPNGIDRYLVYDVFGVADVGARDPAVLIAPQPGLGSLFIGLENSGAPQSISILFQIEEGSVPGEDILRSEDLRWSYLAGNQWRSIATADVFEETTDGFQKPGIIRLNIGHDASMEHSLMPKALRWLRVSVDDPEGAASLGDVFAQAARATLVLPESDSADFETHLSEPLPPNTISKMVRKISTVKKVRQPYPSLEGRSRESDKAFFRRVSERLRHKNRAVSAWDYERLLLESFPEIYKLKCLPHLDTNLELKPGNVWLVVVPDWRKRLTGDPFQPKAKASLLRDITDHIRASYTSPFAQVKVTNPTYETLLVDCKVSFHSGFDPGYYSSVLEEDIKRFLSPWAYPQGQDIVFGGRIHASEILAFIEGREYVDFVVHFELYHRHRGTSGGGIGDMEIGFDFTVGYSPEPTIAHSTTSDGGKAINIDFVIGDPVEVAAATRPDSILVSNAAHRIEALPAGAFVCQGIQNIGIGQMIIGLDFVPIT